MNGSAVLFADSCHLHFEKHSYERVAALLRVLVALQQLTFAEKDYALPAAVAERCGLTPETVEARLHEPLLPCVMPRDQDGIVAYRIEDSAQALIPLLALSDFTGQKGRGRFFASQEGASLGLLPTKKCAAITHGALFC